MKSPNPRTRARLLGFLTLSAIVLASIAFRPLQAEPAPDRTKILEGMTLPEYDERGALKRPQGYERWTFVGTSLGIRYVEGVEDEPRPKDHPGDFHHVYVQPQAFDYFRHFGEFPEKTIFVMTNSPASRKAGPDLINGRGHFAGKANGLEVSVKDTERHYESWSYYLFTTAGDRKATRPLPQNICYDCHAEHAEIDNAFTQFYPILEQARKVTTGP